MNWLARLKKVDSTPTADPTETTKRVSVVFEGPNMAPFQKIGGVALAANDPTPDLDRWCWPHSEAMNTREIDTFTARLESFTGRGLGLDNAQALADKLVARDRDWDERRLCLECINLLHSDDGMWSCAQWRAAGIGAPAVGTDFAILLKRCDAFQNSDGDLQRSGNPSTVRKFARKSQL